MAVVSVAGLRLRSFGSWRRPWYDGDSIFSEARRNGVVPNLLCRWCELMIEGGSIALAEDDSVTGNKTGVNAPCLANVFEVSAGSSTGRVSGFYAWPSMTPRAGMLFGRLGSHRFRELHADEETSAILGW